MSERDDQHPRREPEEGVRIIGADEAQAALDAGEAAGRRPGERSRYADVPPAPSGPRPAHRFPLPTSINPAGAADLPPVVSRRQADQPGERAWSPPPPPDEPYSDEGSSGGQDEPYAPEPSYGQPEVPYTQPQAAYVPPEEPSTGHEPPPGQAQQPTYAQDDDPYGEQGRSYEDRIEQLRGWQDEPHDETHGGQEPRAWQAEAGGQEQAWETQANEKYEDDRYQMEENHGEQTAWGAGPSDATTELGVSPIPEEGISLTGSHEMPHWSDPPTGEVPRLRLGEEAPAEADDEAWGALGTSGARWRHESDWDDLEDVSDLAEDFDPRGALDQTRAEHSDLFSFDADFERVTSSRQHRAISVEDVEAAGGADEYADEWDVEPEPVPSPVGAPEAADTEEQTAPRSTTTRISSAQPLRPGGVAGTRPQRTAPTSSGGDLGGRLLVGAGLVALLVICYAIGVQALLVLAVVVVTAAAAEAYNMTRQIGFRPATLVGLVATVGCVLGVYWKGLEAVPIVAALFFGATMLWFVLGVERVRPLVNVAVTVMVFVWVAVLGSFAAVLLNRPHGRGAFLGAVVVAVVADILAYVIGRWIGNRPIAPKISPNKTIEGYIAGVVGAIVVGAIIGKELAPWGGMSHGIVLGVLIGLVAPAGDLFESLLKRDIGLKDSGSVLAGHGGLLDRFDAILLALPLAYFVLAYFRLA